MLRLFATLALTTTLLLSPARAETDWAKYNSFAKTRCGDPKTIADIKESTKGLQFNDGSGRALLTMRAIEAGGPNMYDARDSRTTRVETTGNAHAKMHKKTAANPEFKTAALCTR